MIPRKCKCGEDNLENFSKDKSRPSGYQYICRACDKKKRLIYEERNKDKIKAAKKDYRINARVKRNNYNNLYAKRYPEKFAKKESKRRATKSNRTPKWLTKDHETQIEIFYKAARALTIEFGIIMEVDHIVPLKGKNVSGLHVPWNLQVIPKSQNCSKSNKFG